MPMDLGEPDRGRRAWHDRLVRHRATAGLLAGAAGLVILGTVFVVLPGVGSTTISPERASPRRIG